MTRRRYAADTEVSVARSQAEIQEMVQRYGCTHFATMIGPKAAARAWRWMADAIDPPPR